MRRALLLVFLISNLCPLIFAQSMKDQITNAKRGDDSDWWSLTRDVDESNIKPQKRVPAVSNFSILGVALGDPEYAQLVAKLGKAPIVDRGDAATGRFQVCYVSVGSSPGVYLIFEEGEVDYAFYLFSNGQHWNGSDFCSKSPLISSQLKTDSGLALGQTRSQVEAILGKPTAIRTDELIYLDSVLMKPADHSDSYDLWTQIEARFSHGRLTYLGVLKSETD
jgi:hypothetical protein